MRSVLIMFFAFALISCRGGGDSGSSSNAGSECAGKSILGSWTTYTGGGTPIDTSVFNSDCTGTATLCNEVFTYSVDSGKSGNLVINYTSSSSGGSCSGPRVQTNTFSIDDSAPPSVLSINFQGSGTLHYIKN